MIGYLAFDTVLEISFSFQCCIACIQIEQNGFTYIMVPTLLEDERVFRPYVFMNTVMRMRPSHPYSSQGVKMQEHRLFNAQLTKEATEKLIHGFIISRLDNGNSLLCVYLNMR